ncbi:MAG: hypothetical protein PVG63_05810, partial [Anaerolineales bacterium]
MSRRRILMGMMCLVAILSLTACADGDGPLAGTTDQGGAATDPVSGPPARETMPGSDGPLPANRLSPEHFTYLGAFRLPDEFAWGA